MTKTILSKIIAQLFSVRYTFLGIPVMNTYNAGYVFLLHCRHLHLQQESPKNMKKARILLFKYRHFRYLFKIHLFCQNIHALEETETSKILILASITYMFCLHQLFTQINMQVNQSSKALYLKLSACTVRSMMFCKHYVCTTGYTM